MEEENMTGAQYRYASKCAAIKAKNIHGKTFRPHVLKTQRVMQQAFNYYYLSYKAIEDIDLPDKTKSPNSYDIMYEKKREIMKDLRNTANNSYFGNDLDWAFDHLADNNGHWYNESFDGWKGECLIPIGIANFLHAIENKGQKILKKQHEFIAAKNKAMELQRNKQWDEIPKNLGRIKTITDDVLPMVWIGCGGIDGFKTATGYGKLMGQWIEYGTKVHSILDKTIKISTSSKSWERIAIEEMSKFVLNKLPIFGSLYASLIDDVPKLITWFERYARKTGNMVANPLTF
ncbi:MAG: hypothetical protein KDB79_02970 [Acidobacteria bacterium]|nr:hypothetical protein [Acidobacteriota bacterium]